MSEKIREVKYSKVKPTDFIDRRYKNIIIVDCYWLKKKERHVLYADYKCDCGNTGISTVDHIKEGRVTSCGCLKPKRITLRNIKHNLYKDNKRLFDVWNNMIQRCENPNNPNFKSYGGRGIKVCQEWHEINQFLKWAYDAGYIEKDIKDRKNVFSIERIDVNGNYEPSNCKWILFSEQGKNKRYSGRQKCVEES